MPRYQTELLNARARQLLRGSNDAVHARKRTDTGRTAARGRRRGEPYLISVEGGHKTSSSSSSTTTTASSPSPAHPSSRTVAPANAFRSETSHGPATSLNRFGPRFLYDRARRRPHHGPWLVARAVAISREALTDCARTSPAVTRRLICTYIIIIRVYLCRSRCRSPRSSAPADNTIWLQYYYYYYTVPIADNNILLFTILQFCFPTYIQYILRHYACTL